MRLPVKELFVITVTITLCAVVSEGVYRMYKLTKYEAQKEDFSNRKSSVLIKDGSCVGHTLRPNAERKNIVANYEAPWSYKINSSGFRSPELQHKTAPRVLILGDSYTFGWAVNDEQTFPSQLQGLLQSRAEVINAGTPGYNTMHEYCFLKENFSATNPDVVILAYVMNDAEPQNVIPSSPYMTFRFAKSWLWEDLKAFSNQVIHTTFRTNRYEYSSYAESFEEGNPKGSDSKSALRQIAKFCREHNVIFKVFILPDFTHSFAAYPWHDIHAKVQDWAGEFEIETVDLLPEFLGKDSKQLSVAGDGHPNAAAHKIIAHRIAKALNGITGIDTHEISR